MTSCFWCDVPAQVNYFLFLPHDVPMITIVFNPQNCHWLVAFYFLPHDMAMLESPQVDSIFIFYHMTSARESGTSG